MNEPVFFGPEQLKEILEDYAATTAKLVGALHDAAQSGEAIDWLPHLPQMHAAVGYFAELCEDELQNLGHWREDGRDLDEVHELVWDEGERLVQWLRRMLGVATFSNTETAR